MELDLTNFNPVIFGIFFTSVYCFIGSIFVYIYPGSKFQEIFAVLFLFFESVWLGLGGVAALEFQSISPVFLFKLSLLVYFFTILSISFYFIIIVTPDFTLKPYHYLNIIGPILAVLLFFIEDYSSYTGDFLSLYYFGSDKMLLPAITSLTLFFYFFYMLYRIIKLYRGHRGEFSSVWRAFVVFILLNVVLTVLWMIDKIFSMRYLWHLYFISGCFPIIGSYLAIKYPKYVHMLVEMSSPKKYLKTKISNIDPDIAIEELITFMSNEKPFLNSGITLAGLASELDYTPHQLSELLNVHMQKNFFSFINHYRIEGVKGKNSVRAGFFIN